MTVIECDHRENAFLDDCFSAPSFHRRLRSGLVSETALFSYWAFPGVKATHIIRGNVYSSDFRSTRSPRRTSTRVFEYRAGLDTPLRRFDGLAAHRPAAGIFFREGTSQRRPAMFLPTVHYYRLRDGSIHSPRLPRRPSLRPASRPPSPMAARVAAFFFGGKDFLLLSDPFVDLGD